MNRNYPRKDGVECVEKHKSKPGIAKAIFNQCHSVLPELQPIWSQKLELERDEAGEVDKQDSMVCLPC